MQTGMRSAGRACHSRLLQASAGQVVRAAQMLARRAGNVGEIAFAVGFRNLAHFAK
jgi:AraC-like DNA-binding protein